MNWSMMINRLLLRSLTQLHYFQTYFIPLQSSENLAIFNQSWFNLSTNYLIVTLPPCVYQTGSRDVMISKHLRQGTELFLKKKKKRRNIEGRNKRKNRPPSHMPGCSLYNSHCRTYRIYSMQPYRLQVDEERLTARTSLLLNLLKPLWQASGSRSQLLYQQTRTGPRVRISRACKK